MGGRGSAGKGWDTMFVANRMTKNPTVVTPDTGIDTAARLMKKGHFRRLPVVEDGKLVGFLNDKDIMRVSPSPATTLSRYEVTTLLSKLKVSDIMQVNVISVGEDATIEEAALLMYKEKVGGLPVVSSVGAVVGIITETDIFKTFVDVMALEEGRTRFTIDTEDNVGVVAVIALRDRRAHFRYGRREDRVAHEGHRGQGLQGHPYGEDRLR